MNYSASLSQMTVTGLLVSLALCALVVLAGDLRRQYKQLTLPFWFAFGCGLLLNGESLASSFLHGRTTYLNTVSGQPDSETAAWVGQLYKGLLFALVIFGLVVALHYGIRRRRRLSPGILIALTIFGVATLAGGRGGGGLFSTSQFALLAMLLAAAVVPGGRPIYLGVGAFGVSVAALSGLMTLVDYQAAVVNCGYKCGVVGGLYFGALGNDNALGLLLATTVPFAWLGFRGRTRLVLTLYILGSTLATGSRTAAVAALATLAVLGLVRSGARYHPSGRHAFILLVVLASGLGVGIFLPLSTSNPSSFTGRGQLWQVAVEHIRESPVLGFGTKAWGALYQQTGSISSAATYSPHNQWLDVRFTAGWVGAVLLVALIARLLVGRPLEEVMAVALILVPVAYIGITERAWSVGTGDWLSFAYVAALCAVPRLSRDRASALWVEASEERNVLPVALADTIWAASDRHDSVST